MGIQHTYFEIEGLLSQQELQHIAALRDSAPYEDGKNTATDAAKEVKSNLQMQSSSQEYMALQQIIMQALNRSQHFRAHVIPKNIYPFLISKYTDGMGYGWHVDSPLMGGMMRTDIAMTIFLNDPSEYEGGELELESPTGTLLYKLPKGHAICYPCTQVHRVRPVLSGERHVAVTWIQSAVRLTEQRSILSGLQVLTEKLAAAKDTENLLALQQNYSNLLRMWSE